MCSTKPLAVLALLLCSFCALAQTGSEIMMLGVGRGKAAGGGGNVVTWVSVFPSSAGQGASGSTVTITNVAVSGTNPLLVGVCETRDDSSPGDLVLTSATFGAQNATIDTNLARTDYGSIRAQIVYWAAPSGTATVTFTFTAPPANANCAVHLFNGADQTTPLRAWCSQAPGFNTSSSCALSPTANDLVFSITNSQGCCRGSPTATTTGGGTATTVRGPANAGDNQYMEVTITVPASGSQTDGFTWTGNSNNQQVTVAWAAAP